MAVQNQYPGRCNRCSRSVRQFEGWLAGHRGAWSVRCRSCGPEARAGRYANRSAHVGETSVPPAVAPTVQSALRRRYAAAAAQRAALPQAAATPPTVTFARPPEPVTDALIETALRDGQATSEPVIDVTTLQRGTDYRGTSLDTMVFNERGENGLQERTRVMRERREAAARIAERNAIARGERPPVMVPNNFEGDRGAQRLAGVLEEVFDATPAPVGPPINPEPEERIRCLEID